MAVVQYTFTHKQYTEHDLQKQYIEQYNELTGKSAGLNFTSLYKVMMCGGITLPLRSE